MATLPSFDNTLGALFVGFSVSAVLYGILLIQVYNYYRRYPSDKVGYKVTVPLLLLLETAHQALIGHSVYHYSITNFLNILPLLDKPIWSLVFQLLLEAVVGSIVKLLFSLRVWRFSKGNIWLTAFLLLLNFGQLALAIVFTVKGYALHALPGLENIRVWGAVPLGIGVLNDMAVAVALCYYLQTMRSNYPQTNSLIRSLTLYAVSTGALTSAMSLSTLIIYNIMPGNFVFVGCYLVLSKLYAVSFVAALNTRQTTVRLSTDYDSNRSSMAKGRRSRLLNIPPPPHAVIRDSPIVTSGGKEYGVSVPLAEV